MVSLHECVCLSLWHAGASSELQCTDTHRVLHDASLHADGPVFDRFSFRNASAIEGQVAELVCETFAFPVPVFQWERCGNPGDSCYTCTNPRPINTSEPKYDSWRPRPASIKVYGIQNVLQVKDVVYTSEGSDRGCYRCLITHEGGSAERLIFLRIRGWYAWGRLL